jgi:hypothetical protein
VPGIKVYENTIVEILNNVGNGCSRIILTVFAEHNKTRTPSSCRIVYARYEQLCYEIKDKSNAIAMHVVCDAVRSSFRVAMDWTASESICVPSVTSSAYQV